MHEKTTELFTQAPVSKPQPAQEPTPAPQAPVTPAPAQRSMKRFLIGSAIALALIIAVLLFFLGR